MVLGFVEALHEQTTQRNALFCVGGAFFCARSESPSLLLHRICKPKVAWPALSGMADTSLDDMLLEAAGRTKNKGRQSYTTTPKRARPATPGDYSSDEPSYSRSDDDDDDDDYDSEDEMGKSVKGLGSRMPLKKRFEAAEREDEEEEEEEEEEDEDSSELSYGSDLYKDDADREKLAAMTELEREMILHERAEARDTFLMRKKAEARKRETRSRQRDQGPPSSRIRSYTTKPLSAKTVKENALHELVARRQRAQDTDSQRKSWEPSLIEEEDSVPSDSEGEEASKEGSDYGDSIQAEERVDALDVLDMKPTFEQIKSITISRSKLAKWFLEPFFEEIIVGCFVRIAFGSSGKWKPIYQLYQVRSVDTSEPDKAYKFANRMTHKYLNCFGGDESSLKRWQMVEVSDHDPEEVELENWITDSVTRMEIIEKQEAITKSGSFVYSAAAVRQMLMEKKLAASRPSNIAAEKNLLMKELALAESQENDSEVERIQTRLKELESLAVERKANNARALALAEMNRKNRFENFMNAWNLKPAAQAGEAGYDPFSRRWTRSRNYYRGDELMKQTTEPVQDEAATSIVEEIQQGKLVDTQAPVDEKTKMFLLHNFDLPISLDGIQRYGGGAGGAPLAFMARKQRIEATCGARVGMSDSRKHTRALTVNDYKRRRGLL